MIRKSFAVAMVIVAVVAGSASTQDAAAVPGDAGPKAAPAGAAQKGAAQKKGAVQEGASEPVPTSEPAPASAPVPESAPPLKDQAVAEEEAPPKFKGPRTTISFDLYSAVLVPGAYQMLDDFAAALKKHPDARYEIQGHADNVGPARRNLIKSVERAQMVMNYLVYKGIFVHNLVPVGYGFDKPAASNATPEGRTMNRRVELIQIDSQKEYDRLRELQARQEKSINR